MNRTRSIALFVALALVSAAAWAQFLGPVGSFHTPMQNQLRAAPSTGTRTLVTGGSPSAFACCHGMSARDRSNMMTQPSYLPNYSLTGRDMASYAVFRGVTRGMRF